MKKHAKGCRCEVCRQRIRAALFLKDLARDLPHVNLILMRDKRNKEMTLPEMREKLVDKIILREFYEGVRDMDGWETLELTVRSIHSKELSDDILKRLEELQILNRSL